MKILASDIVKYREINNLSQKDLAHKIGVSERTIQNYEAQGVIPKSKHAIFLNLFKEKKEGAINGKTLTEQHKQIISDAFLLHENEVKEISIVKKIILAERLDAENNIMREIKGLK